MALPDRIRFATRLPSAFKASKMLSTSFFLSTRPFLLESFVSSRVKGNDRIFTNPPKPAY